MTNFRINVVSDTVCPWCYVGRKQLLQAQQMWQRRHPGSSDTFTVTYSPFQLNPYATSEDKRQFYKEKFGADRVALVRERLNAVGQQVGIDFKFGGRIGNTRDSHRLVHLSKRYGQETHLRTVDGLFAAYFENEGDIMDAAVLRQVAAGAGIPEADFQKAIVDSDEGGAEVDEQASSARASGVSGVPDFTIQDRFRLGGSRDATEFVAVFEKIKALESE